MPQQARAPLPTRLVVVKDLQRGLQHGLQHETRTVPTTSTLAVAQKSTNADWYNNTFPFLFTRAFAFAIVFALGLPHWPLNRLCFAARFDCHNNAKLTKVFLFFLQMWLVFIFFYCCCICLYIGNFIILLLNIYKFHQQFYRFIFDSLLCIQF